MPPLRVLHLNSLLTGGGTDEQCAKVALGLQSLGRQVSVLGPDGREYSKRIRESGVPFFASPPEGPLKLRLILEAARVIRRDKIQILHAHHGRDYWPAIIATKLSGSRPKIVLTRHLAKSPSSWPSRHFLLNRCDSLIAVSQFTASVLRQGAYDPTSPEKERHSRPPLGGDHSKIHVILAGIDTDRFRPHDAEEQRRAWGLTPENYTFAVVGGFDHPRGKGQREFLKAAALIQSRAPNARFLIIGRGSLEPILRADIKKLGLDQSAQLTGQCADMPRGMNAIDCLVHPQIGTEALALVVGEAHACGKPVIASDLDGIPEAFAIGNYGQLVPPESIDALAQAMLFWTSQPRASMVERNALHTRVAKELSVASSVRQVSDLYARITVR